MAASSESCGEHCIGRLYVTLAGNGTIAGVDVFEEAGVLRFEQSRLFVVGGEPSALALRPDGRALFATDTASDELIRVDLVTGAFERRLLGGVGGPVAVSSDGSAVIVGRPAERDLVVFRDADGPGLARNDSNPLWAPIPVCRRRCDEDPAECEFAHPADRAVCETDDGLRSTGEDYDAIYIGEVPMHIVTLGAGVGMGPLVVPCSESEREFAEFAASAVLDGAVLFLGLKGTADGVLAPEIVGTTFCNSPTVAASTVDLRGDTVEDSVSLDDYLTPCPEIPDGRHRFQCVSGGGESGVVIAPGNSGARAWSLAWEGALIDETTEFQEQPGAGSLIDVPVGDGSCAVDGDCPANALCHPETRVCTRTVFTDLSRTLDGLRSCRTAAGGSCRPDTDPADIAFRGDVVEIRTTPIAGCPATACADADGVLDWRVFERRIVGIEQVDDGTRLQLDRAIPAGCFRADGVLDYRIRVGDQWLAGDVERLRPGQQLGPGGDTGRGRSEMFAVPAQDLRVDLTTCERYAVDGRVACEDPAFGPDDDGCIPVMDPVLRRDVAASIKINDQFTTFRSGQSLNFDGNPTGSAGRIPGGMIVSTVGAPEPVIFLSYSGSNSVLGMVPFDVATAFESASRYALLR
jgi:hypothetical protein